MGQTRYWLSVLLRLAAKQRRFVERLPCRTYLLRALMLLSALTGRGEGRTAGTCCFGPRVPRPDVEPENQAKQDGTDPCGKP